MYFGGIATPDKKHSEKKEEKSRGDTKKNACAHTAKPAIWQSGRPYRNGENLHAFAVVAAPYFPSAPGPRSVSFALGMQRLGFLDVTIRTRWG